MQMQEAVSPESSELDLREYENSVIMVCGHESGDWIYSAEVINRGDLSLPLWQRKYLESIVEVDIKANRRSQVIFL